MSDLRGDMVGWLRARATERRLRDINMVGEENVRPIEWFRDWQIANEIARLREHNADLVKLSHLEAEANKKLREQLDSARKALEEIQELGEDGWSSAKLSNIARMALTDETGK